MIRKIMVSVAVGFALFAATVRLPVATWILENTSSPKACPMGCCANKTCCETSQERPGQPAQPLAKAGDAQQNFSAIPATVVAALAVPSATAGSHLLRV